MVIAGEDQLDTRQLVLERAGEEPLVLVAAASDRPAPDELSASELSSLTFVSSPSGLSRERMVSRQLKEMGVSMDDIAIELGHAESMKRAVRAGLGHAFLFRSSVEEELSRGELREIDVVDAHLVAPVVLVRRRNKRFSRMQQELYDAVRDGLLGRVGPLDRSAAE